ncbi:hypothetical protein [Sodalis ligni]|uniref:Uncharacterized protein n=1 Tax=Sodalis ligni TaxID=2697027 RepID=A0A4V2Q3I5_9GAMM|nr:hypothetical protein [Sodalis ligni]TCL06848.1 hypothetical protein EZJ58_5145 [Sodalis ligni]
MMATIITLCGSSRFKDAFEIVAQHYTILGHVVITMGNYGHADYPSGAKYLTNDNDNDGEVKRRLDMLHLQKIDMADEIIVINVGGYIGSSTTREIAYATAAGKSVRYLFPQLTSAEEHQ